MENRPINVITQEGFSQIEFSIILGFLYSAVARIQSSSPSFQSGVLTNISHDSLATVAISRRCEETLSHF